MGIGGVTSGRLAWAGCVWLACTVAVATAPVAAPLTSLEGFDQQPKGVAFVLAGTNSETNSGTSPGKPAAADAIGVDLTGTAKSTKFVLTLSKGVTAEVYTLAEPYRVIVDLPDVSFRLPDGAGRTGNGLIEAFRYGLFAEGKARVVLDTKGPVRIAKAEMAATKAGVDLILEVVPIDASAFGSGTGAPKAKEQAEKAAEKDEPVARPSNRGRPVVMIDPGHGGVDPGAVGVDNLYEKSIVLAVARQLKAKLVASGRYDVVTTRNRDVFVSLDQRLKLSRQASADLFISIHADSIEQVDLAQNIHGATVYTLSERASDARARAMAEKENASDLLAGLSVAEGEGNDQVKSILIDLMKRETANFSTEFSRLLVGSMKSRISLSRDPQRSAAFKVLKQSHAPSVLIELGYVSNIDEARRMASPEWQGSVAASIAKAVDTFFSKRAAGGP